MADDLGGVSVRVSRDLGRQTITGLETAEPGEGEQPSADATAGEAVEVRVIIDPGEQTVGPVTDEGDST
jgi:hypothetical protein